MKKELSILLTFCFLFSIGCKPIDALNNAVETKNDIIPIYQEDVPQPLLKVTGNNCVAYDSQDIQCTQTMPKKITFKVL